MKIHLSHLLHQLQWFLLLLLSFAIVGCDMASTHPNDLSEITIWPTPASNLADLIKNLSDNDSLVRIVSMKALSKYGDAALIAVPKLIENLHYQGWSEVRIAAADALSRFGPKAKEAITDLAIVLQNKDETYHVKEKVAFALGEIADPSTIPALANALNQDNVAPFGIAVNSANAIAKITHEPFRGANPSSEAYYIDQDGVPFVVIDARKWWQEKGQFQDWSINK